MMATVWWLRWVVAMIKHLKREGFSRGLLLLYNNNVTIPLSLRFVRVMPTYYLANLLAVPQLIGGYSGAATGNTTFAFIGTFLCLSTISSFGLNSPLDGPSWTVCTLVWLWLVTPYFLVVAQRLTDFQLVVQVSIGCRYSAILLL